MSVSTLSILSVCVLFAAFWYGEVSSAQCRATTCVGFGRACDVIVQSYQVCQVGLYCTSLDTCQAKIAENQTCLQSGSYNQCANQGRCIQTGGSGPYQCHNYYTVRPGARCTADTQCYYTKQYGGDTLNSTCLANGTCYGLPLGASCDGSAAQCYEGLCSNRNGGVCVPYGVQGAACDPTNIGSPCGDLECMSTDMTNASMGVCAPQGSLAVGAICTYRSQCQDGLYCKIDSTTVSKGLCTQPPAASGKDCTDDSQCTAPETCNCNSATGQGHCYTTTNTIGSTAAFQALLACRKTANCIGNTADCIYAACPTQYCNYTLLSDTKEELLAALAMPCVDEFTQAALNRCNITAAQITASTTTGGSMVTGGTGTNAGTMGTGTGTGTTGTSPSSSSSASALFPVSLLVVLLSIFLF